MKDATRLDATRRDTTRLLEIAVNMHTIVKVNFRALETGETIKIINWKLGASFLIQLIDIDMYDQTEKYTYTIKNTIK